MATETKPSTPPKNGRPLVSCLNEIHKKPAMWLGGLGDHTGRSLSMVTAFITGFQHGQFHSPEESPFVYFSRWVATRYRVNDGPMGGFNLILAKVGGDEHLAFEEFFKLLPEYLRDMAEIGPEAIHARYMTVMTEIRNQHK